MVRFDDSTPAISPEQLRKVFKRLTGITHGDSKDKFGEVVKLEAEYNVPNIVEMAIDAELSVAKNEAMREYLNEPQGSKRKLVDINHERIKRLDGYKTGYRLAMDKHKETAKDSKPALIEDDERYVNVKSALIYNIKDSACYKGPLALLLMLLLERNWGKKKDKHNTYYYWRKERGYVVASMSQEFMARKLGVSESTIKRYLDALVKNGDVIFHLEGRENIYVLGSVDENNAEHWYSSKLGLAKPFNSEL